MRSVCRSTPARKIDRLIEHLRKLASPEGLRGIHLGEMEIRAVREYGVTLVGGTSGVSPISMAAADLSQVGVAEGEEPIQ